jgi:hypothetical protein
MMTRTSISSGLVGLFLGGALSLGVMAVAAPITGPVDPGSIVANINRYILNWMGFTNDGELTLAGGNAFAPLGVVATAMSSVGPVGSHTTVQRWMVVINAAGTVGFVPVF